MGKFEIVVTEEPGPISGLDARGFGVLLRRDTAPDLRCVVRASAHDFRANPQLWDDSRLFRAIAEAELPGLRGLAERAELPEAGQPWEVNASAARVKEILEADDGETDTRLYRFVQVGEVLARWDA